MRRIFALTAALAVLLSGCAKDVSESGDAECLFDNFFSGGIPANEIEFTLPEFPDVKFTWDTMNVIAEKDGEEAGLFWGMPVWSVYLADLNGDGKREICSVVSVGSGIVDERIRVYDYANGKRYELSDRLAYSYYLEIKDGVLNYIEMPERVEGERRSEPLTISIMKEIDE